jgi:hypothetical protein
VLGGERVGGDLADDALDERVVLGPLAVRRWPIPSQSSSRTTPSRSTGTTAETVVASGRRAPTTIQSRHRLPVE